MPLIALFSFLWLCHLCGSHVRLWCLVVVVDGRAFCALCHNDHDEELADDYGLRRDEHPNANPGRNGYVHCGISAGFFFHYFVGGRGRRFIDSIDVPRVCAWDRRPVSVAFDGQCDGVCCISLVYQFCCFVDAQGHDSYGFVACDDIQCINARRDGCDSPGFFQVPSWWTFCLLFLLCYRRARRWLDNMPQVPCHIEGLFQQPTWIQMRCAPAWTFGSGEISSRKSLHRCHPHIRVAADQQRLQC